LIRQPLDPLVAFARGGGIPPVTLVHPGLGRRRVISRRDAEQGLQLRERHAGAELLHGPVRNSVPREQQAQGRPRREDQREADDGKHEPATSYQGAEGSHGSFRPPWAGLNSCQFSGGQPLFKRNSGESAPLAALNLVPRRPTIPPTSLGVSAL